MKCLAALLGENQQGEVGTRWRKGRSDPSPEALSPSPGQWLVSTTVYTGPGTNLCPPSLAGQRTPSFRSQTFFSTQKTFFITETSPDPENPAEGRLSSTPGMAGVCVSCILTESLRVLPQARTTQKPSYVAACSVPHSFLLVFRWLYPLPSPLLSPLHLSSAFIFSWDAVNLKGWYRSCLSLVRSYFPWHTPSPHPGHNAPRDTPCGQGSISEGIMTFSTRAWALDQPFLSEGWQPSFLLALLSKPIYVFATQGTMRILAIGASCIISFIYLNVIYFSIPQVEINPLGTAEKPL